MGRITEQGWLMVYLIKDYKCRDWEFTVNEFFK